jgi:hypothetical protein
MEKQGLWSVTVQPLDRYYDKVNTSLGSKRAPLYTEQCGIGAKLIGWIELETILDASQPPILLRLSRS